MPLPSKVRTIVECTPAATDWPQASEQPQPGEVYKRLAGRTI